MVRYYNCSIHFMLAFCMQFCVAICVLFFYQSLHVSKGYDSCITCAPALQSRGGCFERCYSQQFVLMMNVPL